MLSVNLVNGSPGGRGQTAVNQQSETKKMLLCAHDHALGYGILVQLLRLRSS